jgi:hypothetical protein
MKSIVPIITLVLLSCTESPIDVNPNAIKVRYEVIVESGTWLGSFVDEEGEDNCLCQPPYQDSNWTYDFLTSDPPGVLMLNATSSEFDNPLVEDKANITANIYVDGELVATSTNKDADGKTHVTWSTGASL